MEVLLHDCCNQRHVLGSTLCALSIKLQIYLYNKLHLEEIQQKPVNKWKIVNIINSNTIPDGCFRKNYK